MRRNHTKSFDIAFKQIVRFISFVPIALLLLMLLVLILKSWPSIHTFGLNFFITSHWNPIKHIYGGMNVILGTLITASLALIIAVPLSFGFAGFVLLYTNFWFGNILARVLDFMAGIPSIVFGIWGLFYFIPFMDKWVNPIIHKMTLHNPILTWIFGQQILGFNYLTAGIVLSMMLVPIQTATMISVMKTIPKYLIESAFGLGSNKAEVLFSIMVPYVKGGLLGSIVLGLGRALGETMAVTFVIGNSHGSFSGLLMPGSTIASVVANEYAEALDPLHQSALIELGVFLFVITLVILIIVNLLLHHIRVRGGNY